MDTGTLPKASQLALRAARNPRWQPQAGLPLHSEIFAPATQGCGAGAALAFLQDALRAIELSPNYREAYLERGNIKRLLKDVDGARQDWLVQLQRFEGTPAALSPTGYLWGNFCSKFGKRASAV